MAISKCQRRFAPTPDRFPPGTVIGFLPELPIGFSGILTMAGPGALIASAIPMQQLVTLLGRWMDRPIVDNTGLTGYVDVKLRFAPESAPRPSQVQPSFDGAVPPPSDDPSIFTAVEEQLGLKLEPAQEPTDVLVIDSARKPLEN